ncbi:hypothetical protein [Paenibacillus sp. ATY16]|uniref:hypothetical protein n=1 Tax=Paenibacillus sp. ATY16 TaxID=1759312 RepID=UPI00200F70B2|nr:hypothetical protein [Paenibacillus sp. ATY16]MCK9858311.1 hypothetical protein [Paenibacillus sp. ATY16]
MDNNTYFFHFTFNPSKLRRIRHEVEKRYEDIDQLTAMQLKGIRLPQLLELVRNTSEEDIYKVAQSLRKSDVMILLYAYPYPEENNETKRKINLMLTERYSVTVGTFAWELFQYFYEDPFLQDLLRRIYAVDSFEFLLLNAGNALQEAIKKALTNRNGVAKGIVPLLTSGSTKVADLRRHLKLKLDAPLETYLLFDMLRSGLYEDIVIKREGEQFITQQLEKYSMEDYQGLMKIYLEARKREQYHTFIMEQAIRRLHDPRERNADWHFLNDESMLEVNRWLLEIELKKFFEGDTNQRFEFWKRYLLQIDNVVQLKEKNDPKVAFIYFKDFVVVEFGNIGSAYFYHRVGFDQKILSRTYSAEFKRKSETGKEGMLKETARNYNGQLLFINRLGHHGYSYTWMEKFKRHMDYYLDGLFEYTEG